MLWSGVGCGVEDEEKEMGEMWRGCGRRAWRY
jgi:hypothetical protein